MTSAPSGASGPTRILLDAARRLERKRRFYIRLGTELLSMRLERGDQAHDDVTHLALVAEGGVLRREAIPDELRCDDFARDRREIVAWLDGIFQRAVGVGPLARDGRRLRDH